MTLISFIPFIRDKSENSGSTYHWTINFHPPQPLFPFPLYTSTFSSLSFLFIDPPIYNHLIFPHIVVFRSSCDVFLYLNSPIFYLSAQFSSLKQHYRHQNFKIKNQAKLKRKLLRTFHLFLRPLTKRYNIVLLVSLLCRF